MLENFKHKLIFLTALEILVILGLKDGLFPDTIDFLLIIFIASVILIFICLHNLYQVYSIITNYYISLLINFRKILIIVCFTIIIIIISLHLISI